MDVNAGLGSELLSFTLMHFQARHRSLVTKASKLTSGVPVLGSDLYVVLNEATLRNGHHSQTDLVLLRCRAAMLLCRVLGVSAFGAAVMLL